MSKTVAGVILAVVAIAALGGIYAANKPAKDTASEMHNQSMNMASDQPAVSNQQPAASSNEVLSGTVEMDIRDFAYSKPAIKVKKGTVVKWTNQDSARHDITPDDGGSSLKASELLAKGESYSFTFDSVGTFTYHCSPHPYMKATVEVVE